MRFSKYLGFTLIGLVLIAVGAGYCSFAANEKFIFDINLHQPLELAPYNTQLLFKNDQLNALSIIQGKIYYFNESSGRWIELQRFGPHDMNFTTFEIKDLNGDSIPELIAGTEEPGLIYLYSWNNNQWNLINYGKHVWSTVNKIIAGNLIGDIVHEFLVQNDEGYLFLLKASEDSIDLIWKSPEPWQLISAAIVADVNHDFLDEIMVVYKSGGIGVLKVENNAVVSVWGNYPWGKVLGLTSGDWDNDQQTEIIFCTSQKLLYVLGVSADKYIYEGQFSNFNCIIEKLAFLSDPQNEYQALVTTDTAGILKILRYDFQKQQWVEQFNYNTGRILLISQPHREQVFLWSANRRLISLSSYKTIPLKVKFQNTQYQLEPSALFFKDRIYLASKALSEIVGMEISYNEQTQVFKIKINERLIEISKKEPSLIRINEINTFITPITPLFLNNELYLALDSYHTFLNLSIDLNLSERLISIP